MKILYPRQQKRAVIIMNNYIGKTCPFCKTEFQEGDDIVICSSCDMPHHKACWIENQGCTTFGCMGTIKSPDDNSTTVTTTKTSYEELPLSSYILCTQCGAQNLPDSAFCGKCGNSLKKTSSIPADIQNNPSNTNSNVYTQQNSNHQTTYQNNTYGQQNHYSQTFSAIDEDVIILVGKKQEYYIPKFQEMKTQNTKASWNWPAFLFSMYWCLYRKMYGYAFAFVGITSLLTFFVPTIAPLLLFISYIIFGIFANYIYMKKLEKNANKAKTMNEPLRTQFIQKHSGVSVLALILFFIGWCDFMIIIIILAR